MPDTQVKDLVLLSYDTLKKVQAPLEDFLNFYALPQLITSESEEEMVRTKAILSELRHLLVYCEATAEKLGIINRSKKFNKDFAEHVLYETVHLCINKFYYPTHELYEEDGRYSYTGTDAIKFSYPTQEEMKKLIISLSKDFEMLRDELYYYETDYVTQKRLQGEPI